jgi:hypothetical protein
MSEHYKAAPAVGVTQQEGLGSVRGKQDGATKGSSEVAERAMVELRRRLVQVQMQTGAASGLLNAEERAVFEVGVEKRNAVLQRTGILALAHYAIYRACVRSQALPARLLYLGVASVPIISSITSGAGKVRCL